jgi:hypothetical protein
VAQRRLFSWFSFTLTIWLNANVGTELKVAMLLIADVVDMANGSQLWLPCKV